MAARKAPDMGREVLINSPHARGTGSTEWTGKVVHHLSTQFVIRTELCDYVFPNDSDWQYLQPQG